MDADQQQLMPLEPQKENADQNNNIAYEQHAPAAPVIDIHQMPSPYETQPVNNMPDANQHQQPIQYEVNMVGDRTDQQLQQSEFQQREVQPEMIANSQQPQHQIQQHQVPMFQEDNRQQMSQQQIEKQLIEQDNNICIDESNSTSNQNIDSGTLKQQEGLCNKQNPQNQIDYFKNFYYDKNQNQHKDNDDQYIEPPSYQLNDNNKIDSYSYSPSKDGQQGIQSQMHELKPSLQPTIQESEIIDESEQKQFAKRTQGLPQPYDSTVYYDFKDFPDHKWEPFKDKVACPPDSFFDARNMENNGEKMENLLKGSTNKPILFDLQNTWLKGEQYAHILQNQDRYCQTFGIHKYEFKQHPESIYIDPKDGLLYFVEGATIGSDFGFPRLGIRKRFKWKKMNFTTDLPKRDPLVSYIVASAVKCEKFFPGSNDDGPVYRMHAVILKKTDPTLQLPSTNSDSLSPNKLQTQQSQDTNMLSIFSKDKANDQQPRSKSGRVLTKSTKLKASQISSGSTKKQDVPQTIQQPVIDEGPVEGGKNYILCHVRRVMGKREDEGESDNGEQAADSPLRKEGNEGLSRHQQMDNGQRPGSKIPNKGKSKFDQIPLLFSEESVPSPCKDKKIPNLEMFQGKSLDQIKKMKVGADGKPLSLYKIKKYILPYNKMISEQMKGKDKKEEDSDSENRDNDIIPCNNNQSQGGRGRKRRNPVPLHELDKQISMTSVQVKEESYHEEYIKKEQVKEDVQNKKQINVEMLDEKSNKQETFNNSQRVVDQSNTVGQINNLIDQDLNVLNTANPLNLGNQNQLQLDQALALNLLSGNNSFGQNYLGLQNPLNPVNGLMLNQLGALQNFGGQNQFGLNSLLGANPNNLGLNADLALQNQLLGLQGNLGLNNFAAGNQNLNNLLRVNSLAQSMNFNGLINQQNQLNNINNLQIQQLLNNQIGGTNPQFKLNNLNNNNDLFLLPQQVANGNNNGVNMGGGGSNRQNMPDVTGGSQKKRDNKMMKKIDSIRLGDPLKNPAISPNLMAKDNLNGVSPQLKNIGNGLLGPMLGNVYPGMSGNAKRKQTTEYPNIFKDEPGNDLLMHFEKEYTRRLSGHMKTNIDDLNSKNGSPKSHNMSNLMKSPNIPPMTQKLQDLNNQKMQSNLMNSKRRASLVSNFGRDRINSKVSAFKKFDSMIGKQKDQATSPLIEGKNGEPSFGPESIQESKSVTTIRAPKNSVETSTIQNISKKNDSNFSGQNNKGGANKNGMNNNNNHIEQQLLQLKQIQQYQQILNQLPGPGQNLDQFQMNNLNSLQPLQQPSAQFGGLNGQNPNFNQNQLNQMNRSNNFLMGMNDQNMSSANQQIKNPGNQQNQQLLLQQFQQQQLMLQRQCLLNQILAQPPLNMGNNNFNTLDILQQSQLFSNPQEKNGDQHMNHLNGKSNMNNNDNQQINQQINIIQNSKIQPVLSGLIVSQFGNQDANYQGRKDSFQKSKNTSTQSPKIGNQVRSRKDSSNFRNQLMMALAPNPSQTLVGNQPQDEMMGINTHNHGSSMMIPPPNKQDQSHRNSNVSTTNIMNFGPRKSTDITPFNKHKFSITGAVINNPSIPNNNGQNNHHNSNGHPNNNMKSQLSNTGSNRGGTQSHPISQEANNQQGYSSPDRNLDSAASNSYQKQQDAKLSLNEPSFMKMPGQQQQLRQQDLMKSPGISGSHYPNFGNQGTQHLQNSRRQSNNIDLMGSGNMNKYPNNFQQQHMQQNQMQQQQMFMPPISRHSSQLMMPMNNNQNNINSVGGMGIQEPESGARTSDEQNKQYSTGGLKNMGQQNSK